MVQVALPSKAWLQGCCALPGGWRCACLCMFRRAREGLGFIRVSVFPGHECLLLRASSATLAAPRLQPHHGEELERQDPRSPRPLCRAAGHCHTSSDMLAKVGPVLCKMWRPACLQRLWRLTVAWTRSRGRVRSQKDTTRSQGPGHTSRSPRESCGLEQKRERLWAVERAFPCLRPQG